MACLRNVLVGAALFACGIASPVFAADHVALSSGSTRVGVNADQALRMRLLSPSSGAATTSAVKAKELSANASRAYPASCFSDILPVPQDGSSLPQTPTGTLFSGPVTLYATDANNNGYTENVTITVWRVPCSSSGDKLSYNPDGGAVAATLMRIQRQSQYEGDSTIYPLFPVIRMAQGSIVFNDSATYYLDLVRVAPEPNTVIADTPGDLPVINSTTYVLENYPFVDAGFFYFNNAFQIRFDNFITDGSVQRQFVFNVADYVPTQAVYPAAFAPLKINGYLSGSWFDPAHGGEGLLTQVFDVDGASRIFVATWYTFGQDGLPFWLVAQGTFPIGATQIQNMQVTYRTGGGFAGNFTGTLPQPVWGTMSVQFPNCNQLTFSYSGAASGSVVPGGTGTKTWTRIGSINSLACQ
jgi:hypothetical protein